MPLPGDIPTFTLVASFPPMSPDGAERTGSFTFTPIPGILPSPDAVYLGVENATLNASGSFAKELIACDAFAEPFMWRLDGDVDGYTPFSVNISVAASAGTVNLGAIAEFETLPTDYVVIIGPQGPAGDGGGGGGGTPSGTVAASTSFGQSPAAGSATAYSRGDHVHGTPSAPTLSGLGGLAKASNLSDVPSVSAARTNLGLGTAALQAASAFDTSGAASLAQAGAATYTDGKIATEVTRANSAYDAAGAAAAALVSANAYTDGHSGGGGVSIRTASVRITDDNLAGLPSASGWTVAVTSAATPLQASIAAAAGDRIRVCGNFMRAGSHFLDWALLDSAGAIALYASTGTGTAPGEGNPALYPSLSFSYATSDEMFTVASGHIAAGLVTVALAHQGTGSGLVYAHTTYPWRLRLENIGPEPS